MAESVVSFVVEKIGELLIQEGKFLAGVSGQVRQMQDELRRMQCFLEDVDKRQDETKLVRGWVSDIRELAYDAENVIETFVLEIASRRDGGFLKQMKRYATICFEFKKMHKLGNEIKAIEGRITSLTTSLTTYGILIKNEPEGSRSMQQKFKRSYSHLVEGYTVGLDNDVNILVKKLSAEETDVFQIVSICGMGGIGKTTLANKLYHHVEVRHHFKAFAWYCVSQQFQARQVWEGILIKLIAPSNERRDQISRMKDDEIAKELYLLQQKMKCLVVLDDIWTDDAWDLLKPAFPTGMTVGGSKIVLTTRNKTLALHADGRAFIHELQTLNENDSWELFQTKALLNNINSAQKFNINMKNIGMKIVKKCEGLPLAIIVLGGLLATKDSLTEWEKVHENVDSYLSGKRANQEYSIVHGVLALSYNELPYHLKPCFIHLGNFSEDYDIHCKTLLRMWTAEGFVSQCQNDGERNETMENVVERYLDELVDRSIVQVSQVGLNGKVKTCRLHDLMRDFCLSKANEENYLQIVRVTNLNVKLNSIKVRRLVVHLDGEDDFDLRHYMQTPNLRSFLLSVDNYSPTIKSLSTNFKFLKIMSLEDCSIGKETRKEIGSLIHLRYLAFKKCEIEALPSSIENLRYLQSLLIIDNMGEIVVPNVLWKLGQLRHVILGRFCVREGLRLGKMINLRTLQLSHLSDVSLLDVGELVSCSHLNKLAISLEENLDEIPSACLGRLTSLTVKSTSSEEELERFFSSCPQLLKLDIDGLMGNTLPEWQHFPPNLSKLTLRYGHLDEDPMPILEKLPNLRYLRLHWRSFSGRLLVCSSQGFPKLQTLHLIGLRYLKEWTVDEEAMPNLSQLHMQYCEKLKMIPEGIKFITTLRHMEIKDMPKEFKDRVRDADGKEGEDFYKVRHVTSINI